MPPRKNSLPSVGGYNEFNPKFPLGKAGKDSERTKSVSFRVAPVFYQMAEQLRTHPKSPFYGMFDAPDDLERHIYVAGVLALALEVPGLKEGAQDLIIRERTLAQIAVNAKHREYMQTSIDNLVNGVSQDLVHGDVELALRSLDAFLDELLGLEDEHWRGEYAKRLINTPGFDEIGVKLRKRSKFLKDFEKEYS